MKIINSIKKYSTIYNITYILAFFWILISIIKPLVNYDGLERYQFIQRNTIGGWLLLFISLSLSKHFFKKYIHTVWIFIVLFLIHEYLYYFWYIQITKDEGEITSNWYRWSDIYCDPINNKSITHNTGNDNSADFSEALFNNMWDISNEEAYKNKFDTYFRYLKLKPGMKLLDLGCGNCHWLQYCTSKGIECTGLTITKEQGQFCNKNGISNVIVGDIRNDILLTINDKFDAVSAIGTVEHYSTMSEPKQIRQDKLKKFYSQVMNLINPNSESRRYLNSYMTTNKKYSKINSLEYNYQFYFVASFGYGFYNTDEKMSKIYNNKKSKILIKRDYTEDYRWIMVRDKNSIGFCNYKFDTPYRIMNFFGDVLLDPSWLQRAFYGYFDSWFWQFGGTNPQPMPENKDTPIRSYIYVTEITP